MKENFFDISSGQGIALYSCYRDENIAPGRKYGPVVVDLYIIECCTKGSGSIVLDGKEIPFTAGDAYILSPGQKVLFTADPVTSREGVWCSIGGTEAAKAIAALGLDPEYPFLPHSVFGDAVDIISRMVDMKSDADLGAPLRRVGLVYSLLGAVSQHKSAKDKNIWISKAIGYIESNYYKQITVSDIADEVGLERCYFSTLFNSRVGMTPHAYLSEVRAMKAASLLADSDFSVTAAARAVGLDVQNFARIFKKVVGCNPKDYKKQKIKP